jgi:alpha-beta hydrolase superfamily lysophospholipase
MSKKSVKHNKSFWHRHKLLIFIFISLLGLFIAFISYVTYKNYQQNKFQKSLDPFYNTAGLDTNGPVGQLIRSEPLGISVPNGTGIRILYRTERADGSKTFASGMVFIPNQAPANNRPVVAWAHGTIGMGPQCAPSRLENPISNINWIGLMMQRGWVVTATDYAGLGTPGVEGYLVGQSEAHDVLNSVRAVRQISSSQAGNSYAVWGHSQGGHSALFTANLSASYAPELRLVGTVASAPAAELGPLLNEQYGQPIDWVIGPEAVISWPATYTNLNRNDVLTNVGQRNYQQIANQCIDTAALEGIVRGKLDQQFFATNLTAIPSWNAVVNAQTAPVLKPSQPVMVAESLTDTVVLPNTTALYIQKACKAGSNLNSLWLNNVGHIALQQVIGPAVVNWIGDRFANSANMSTCNQPLPITPAT